MSNDTDDVTDLEKWKVLSEAVRRAHDARIDEVQNQQARITSVLTTTGFVFAFVGTSAPVFVRQDKPVWPAAYFFLLALIALAIGIVVGAAALRPRINLSRPLYLEADLLARQGSGWTTQELLEHLITSIADDELKSEKVTVLKQRRQTIKAQLYLIVIGVVLLMVAFCTRFLAS